MVPAGLAAAQDRQGLLELVVLAHQVKVTRVATRRVVPILHSRNQAAAEAALVARVAMRPMLRQATAALDCPHLYLERLSFMPQVEGVVNGQAVRLGLVGQVSGVMVVGRQLQQCPQMLPPIQALAAAVDLTTTQLA